MISLAGEIIELRVPSKPEYVSIVRSLVADLAERLAFPAAAVEDVRVAVSEACANVVCHAYGRGVDSVAPEILIRCSARGKRLVMEIADTGHGFERHACGTPKHTRENGGFGLVLIRNLMDDVSLSTTPDEGTTVRMVKQVRNKQMRLPY